MKRLLVALLLAGCASHGLPPSGIIVPPLPNEHRHPLSQTLAIGTWGTITTSSAVVAICQGHDGSMWAVEQDGSVDRIDLAGNETKYALKGTAEPPITPNPDGNVYAIETMQDGSVDIAQVTPKGPTADFPIPTSDQVTSIVSGSDQRLWMSRIGAGGAYAAAMTVQGQYDQFPTFYSGDLRSLSRGPDKNVWGMTIINRSWNYVRLNIADGSPTFYPGIGGTTLGPDSSFWGIISKHVYRFDPTTGGNTAYQTTSKAGAVGVFIKKNLRYVDTNTSTYYLYSFNITKGKIVKRIPAPGPGFVAAAPNDQLWLMNGNTISTYQL